MKDWKKQAKEMLGECFRRGGRKSEMEKKDERIANLVRQNEIQLSESKDVQQSFFGRGNSYD